MPTVSQVEVSLRTALTTGLPAIPFRFKNETAPLPKTPAAFVYVELVLDPPSGFVAYGGGRGFNTQRSTGRLEAQVLFPAGIIVTEGLDWGEQICALFRGQRLDDVSYLAAEPLPSSGQTEDGNYDHIATAVVELFFDKLG